MVGGYGVHRVLVGESGGGEAVATCRLVDSGPDLSQQGRPSVANLIKKRDMGSFVGKSARKTGKIFYGLHLIIYRSWRRDVQIETQRIYSLDLRPILEYVAFLFESSIIILGPTILVLLVIPFVFFFLFFLFLVRFIKKEYPQCNPECWPHRICTPCETSYKG